MRRQRTIPKPMKVCFKIFYQLQSIKDEMPIVWPICQLVKIISIIIIIIPLYASLPGFPNSNIYSELYISLNIIFSIFTILVFAVTCATFSLEYLFFNDLGCLQAHKSILKANSIVSSITFYTLEMFYHVIGFYITWKFANQSSYRTIDFISFTLGICIYLVQTILFLNQRLFRLAAFIIPIFGVVFTPLPRFVILLVFSLFYLYKQKQSKNKIFYITVIIACIWSLLQTQTSSNSGVIAFLSLGLILSSIIGSYYFWPFTNDNYLQLETNKRLLQSYKKRVQKEHERGQQSLKINMEEELIYEKYLQEVQQSYQICISCNIKSKSVSQWQTKVMSQILWQKITRDYKKEPYQAMVLFYYKAGVILSNRVIPLLKEMSAYFQKNQNGKIMNNYEHYKLIQEVFKYYEQSRIGGEISLQVSDIIQSQNNYHCFYIIINSLLLELADYWRQVFDNNGFISEEVQNKLEVILNLEKEAILILKKNANCKLVVEENILKMIQSIINNYQPNKQAHEETAKAEKHNNFQYITLKGEKIEKLSLKFLKSLNYQMEHIEKNIRILLPQNFYQYLLEVQRLYLQNVQRKEFILPLLHSSGCMIIKKCQMYLMPMFNESLQTMITFNDTESPNHLSFLYNVTKQKIENFNMNLSQFLGIKASYFDELIREQGILSFNDVFQTEIGPNQISTLKDKDCIKTRIIYKDYIHQHSSDEVTLNLDYNFEFNDFEYLLVSVLSQVYRQQKASLETFSQMKTKAIIKQKQLHQQYANQQFFCKIENPYKSKVVEKFGRIQIRSYKSYFYQLSIIKFTGFLIVLISIVIYNQLSISLITKNESLTKVMSDKNMEFISLLRLYSSCYSNYLFTNNASRSQSYLNNIIYSKNATTSQLEAALANLTAYYSKSNDFNTELLMSTYLLYKGIETHFYMNYLIQLSNFNVTTSTQLTSFYDFIIQIQQGFKDGSEIPFLVDNFNSVISIIPVYGQYLQFVNDSNTNYSTLIMIGQILLSLVIFFVLVGFYSTACMIEVHQRLHGLYNYIEKSDIGAIIKQLDLIKNRIGNIYFEEKKVKKKYRTELAIPKKQSIESYIQKMQSSASVEDNIIKQKQKQKRASQKTFRKNIERSCKYVIFCPIILLYSLFLVNFSYTDIRKDQQNYSNILNLLQKLQIDQIYIQKKYISIFQQAYYYQIFNQTINTSDKTITKNQFNDDNLPGLFKSDVGSAEILCQSVYLSQISIPIFNKGIDECKSMELGIMTLGYSEVLQLYQSSIREIVQKGFSNILSTETTNKLDSVIYMKQVLTAYLSAKKKDFFTEYNDYMINLEHQKSNSMIYFLLGLLGTMIALAYNLQALRRLLFIMTHLICIIPEYALQKIKMTNYIRKEDLLTKIDRL